MKSGTSMKSKSTIAHRESRHSQYIRGGAPPVRGRMSARSARPIRTICSWCEVQGKPAAVLVDVPIDDRGISHGLCASCQSHLRSDWVGAA
jgi:hypothetical protein